jgi:Flp pilus assembly protein TadD
MHAFIKVNLLLVMLAVSNCGAGGGPSDGTPDQRSQSSHWTTEASLLLARGECEKAIAVLRARGGHPDEVRWYSALNVAYLKCGLEKRRPAYMADALLLMDQGISRFPHSSRLLAEKAAVLVTLDRRREALELYEKARELALANIRADASGLAVLEDRETLHIASSNIDTLRALLETARTPER